MIGVILCLKEKKKKKKRKMMTMMMKLTGLTKSIKHTLVGEKEKEW